MGESFLDQPAPRGLKLAIGGVFLVSAFSVFVALLFGAYTCATERPARELFLPAKAPTPVDAPPEP